MGKYIKVFNNHNNYNQFIMSGEAASPNVSYCIQKEEVHYNPEIFASEYFTTIAREDGTISFNIQQSMGTDMITSISYSTDNGETWTTTNNTNNKSENLVITVNVNNDDKVMWKGDATQTADYDNDVVSYFSSTCEFDAQGNIMSLLYADDFKNKTTIETEGCFYYLFSGFDGESPSKLVDASKVALSATVLAVGCYNQMFLGCTSLTTAPELPATTLARNCYFEMFQDCTSLTVAPELSATTLANECYRSMFSGCTNLNSITCLATNISATDCTKNWINGVAANGTFTKASSMNSWTTGVNGIPTGWTVQTANN